MSHEGLGYLTAHWLYQKGEVQRAIDFANSYAAHYGRRALPIRDASDLKRILSSPGVQKTVEWENTLFANHQYYDHMQIHNGAPWYDLQTVLDFLHTNLQVQGDDKPLELWETWYSWKGAPGNGFDPRAQAREIVKFMAVAFFGKVTVYNYWLFNDWAIGEGHPGLVDKEGNPRPAGIAFKVASEKLTGSTRVQKLNLGNREVYAYQFTNSGKDVYVIWSSSPTTIDLNSAGFAGSGVTITDISGAVSTQNPSLLSVGASPMFAE